MRVALEEGEVVVSVHLDMKRFAEIHPLYEGKLFVKVFSIDKEFESQMLVKSDSPRAIMTFYASFSECECKGKEGVVCTVQSEGYDEDETNVYFSYSHIFQVGLM